MVAAFISVLFHPVFIPLYGLLIIYSTPTLLSYIPLNMKKVIFMMVIANNVILPLSVTAILYSRGVIKSMYADERRERIILLSFALVMYVITAMLLVKVPVPTLFKAYFVSVAAVALVSLIITSFYKLSLHAAGIGGLLALTGFLTIQFKIVSMGHVVTLLLIAGAVLTSRLSLEKHKPEEVWYGLLTGTAVVALSLFFLLS
ncbi:MAG TPA: hypothetical protein VMV74_05860 [Bacteroidales bacterium]|nr:hypothetical protein [Bacteroidales bacterium]